MFWLITAGLFFGLVNPGCKWITSGGLALLPFCFLFVLFRVLCQLPIVWKQEAWKISSSEQWRPLLALGLVGAALRLAGFLGIVEGLPISLVSFLIYLHPVWTIIFSRWMNGDAMDGLKIFKIGAAVLGTALLCDLSSVTEPAHFIPLWSPIAAGMLIALWICLSTKAQRAGTPVVSIAFYYDLFTLIPIIAMCWIGMDAKGWLHMVQWITVPSNFGIMLGYTLLTGVLPNYAFYFGLRHATAIAAALLMLFEPIASTLIAVSVWNEPISSSFYWGAILILMINLPDQIFLLLYARRWAPFRKSIRARAAGEVTTL